MAAILAGSGSGSQSILGTPLGAAGSGIYTGMTLVGGMDFANASVASAIATPQNPKGALFPTRAYSNTGGTRSPATGPLAVMTDPSADYTGWNDFSRGIRPIYDSGASHQVLSLTDAAGPGGVRNALRLHACRQSTAEQVFLATGVGSQIERGAMVHTLASLWWCAPAKVNVRAAIPTGPRGWHPTIWSMQIPGNAYCYNGSEHGFECNGLTSTFAYEDPHTNGSTGANVGTLDLSTTYRGSTPHDWCIDETFTAAGKLTYFVDGVQVNQLTASQVVAGANPSYGLWTSHIYNASFGGETYVAADWAALGAGGVNFDVFGIQIWVPTGGKLYTPLTTIPDQLCTAGQAISFSLPSATALWGSAVTDQTFCIPSESEEPGNSNTGWPGVAAGAGLPLWLSYNSGTRTYSGTVPSQGGSLNMVVGYCPAGNACRPATFRIVVAPIWTGATSLTLTNGTPASIDLFSGWDLGRNEITSATAQGAKAVTASSIPAGMALGTDGVLTGTPTVTTSYTLVTTATNNDGQQTSQNIAVTVQAAAAGVAAPAVTSATLVGSWDPGNAASITFAGSNVSSLAGVDGTAFALANAASTGPTVTTVTDGNGANKNALTFNGSTQYLALLNAMGLSGAASTFIVVVKTASAAATAVVLDFANQATGFTGNRIVLLGSTSTGYQARKHDTSAVQCVAAVGTAYTTGVHFLVGRSPSGASQACTFNFDGGANIVGTPVSGGPSGPGTLTIGADNEAGTRAKFYTGSVLRILAYQGVISDAEITSIVNPWLSTNY